MYGLAVGTVTISKHDVSCVLGLGLIVITNGPELSVHAGIVAVVMADSDSIAVCGRFPFSFQVTDAGLAEGSAIEAHAAGVTIHW